MPDAFGFGPWVSTAVPTNLPSAPTWFPTSSRLAEDFGGTNETFWHMSQLADETGANLLAMVAQLGTERALAQLRVQVAAQRGVPMISFDDHLRLFNLDVAARTGYPYSVEDLRWFFDAAQRDPDLMLKLGRAVGDWDVATAEAIQDVGAAMDPQMTNSLNQILQNRALADVVAATPLGMRGAFDVTLPDGNAVRLYGQLGDPPPLPGTGTFPDILSPPAPATGSFPHVLGPSVAGGPVVGVGAGQGLVGVPPTVAPGGRLPSGFGGEIPPTWMGDSIPPTWMGDPIPPTWTGHAGDIPPTWMGDSIPPTWMGDSIPPTWTGRAGDIADTTPTWTGGYTPPLGVSFPPPPMSAGPLTSSTTAFGDPITLPPGVLDGTLAPGVLALDSATDLTRTLIDEGRTVLMAGDGVPLVLRSLPGDTPATVVSLGATPGAAPVVQSGVISQFFDGVGFTVRDPWFQRTNEVIGTGEDAAFLIGQASGPLLQDGLFGDGALIDPAGILQLAQRAAGITPPGSVFVGDYSSGGYGAVSLPGLQVGMQAVCTPSGVSVFGGSLPMYSSPSAPTPAGLAAGFSGGVGAQIGTLDFAVDVDSVRALHQELVQRTGRLAPGSDWFHTPDDYLDELDDFGVTQRGFSFAWWGGGGSSGLFGEWGWNFVLLTSNPTETLLKRLPYIGLGDQMTEQVMTYRQNHVGDFADLNSSLSSMITDLEWVAEHLEAWSAPLVAAQATLDQAMADASAFGIANPEWRAQNTGAWTAKMARDLETRSHLAQSLASLRALSPRLGPLINWLREVQQGPGGLYKRSEALLAPTSILRVSGTHLQVVDALAGVLLLAPPDEPPPPQEETRYKPTVDEMIERNNAFRASLPPDDYEIEVVGGGEIPTPTPEEMRDWPDRQ